MDRPAEDGCCALCKPALGGCSQASCCERCSPASCGLQRAVAVAGGRRGGWAQQVGRASCGRHTCTAACSIDAPHVRPTRQVASLRALGLNIRRAKLEQGQEHKFYVTDERTSEKAGGGGLPAPAQTAIRLGCGLCPRLRQPSGWAAAGGCAGGCATAAVQAAVQLLLYCCRGVATCAVGGPIQQAPLPAVAHCCCSLLSLINAARCCRSLIPLAAVAPRRWSSRPRSRRSG